MADKITTYSERTALDILARLNRLESRQNSLLSGGLTQSFPQNVHPTRWARTCTTSDYPTYPTSGNVVAVEFGDYEPSPLSPGSTATKAFTAYDPQVAVLATGDNSPLPFQGQVVPVVWRNGKWWFIHPNFRRATADSSISAGSSGQVSLFDDTTDMGSRTAYYTWGDSGGATINSGDEIFVAWFDADQKWVILPPAAAGSAPTLSWCMLGLDDYWPLVSGAGSTSDVYYDYDSGDYNRKYCKVGEYYGDLASVGVTINTAMTTYTDHMFTLDSAGLYRFTLQLQTRQSTYTGSSSNDNHQYTTSSALSSPNAHTHTVDVYKPQWYAPKMTLLRQAAGGGAWDSGPPNYGGARSCVGGSVDAQTQGGNMDSRTGVVTYDPTIATNDKFRVELGLSYPSISRPAGTVLKYDPEMVVLFIERLGGTPSGPTTP